MVSDEEIDRISIEISQVLKERRFELGFSIQELSYRSGVDRSTIRRIEESQRQPNLATLLRITDALELSCGDLLKNTESKDKAKKESVQPLELPKDVEKAILKLRKKCLEKPDIGEGLVKLARHIF